MAEECFQITSTNKKESKKEMRVEKNEFLFVQEIKYFLLKKKIPECVFTNSANKMEKPSMLSHFNVSIKLSQTSGSPQTAGF